MYVVTGATGNTGSVVVNHLLTAGKKVRGIGRHAGHLLPLAQKGCETFVCDLTNREGLAEAFTGAEGVYVMIPPDPTRTDFRAHQDAVTDSIASALVRSKVKHIVMLSSIGADKAEKTGPVLGLHRMEERLKEITGLNALYLRAGYFMENTLMQAEMIQKAGIAIGPLLPELKIPMIATRDIGAAAAAAMLKLDFNSHQTRELLGPRDMTMHEVATAFGKAIGMPDLRYVQGPEDQIRAGMQQMGMSADLVRLILEMTTALNNGHMKALEVRNSQNTTRTTFEMFVQQQFLPYYRDSKAA